MDHARTHVRTHAHGACLLRKQRRTGRGVSRTASARIRIRIRLRLAAGGGWHDDDDTLVAATTGTKVLVKGRGPPEGVEAAVLPRGWTDPIHSGRRPKDGRLLAASPGLEDKGAATTARNCNEPRLLDGGGRDEVHNNLVDLVAAAGWGWRGLLGGESGEPVFGGGGGGFGFGHSRGGIELELFVVVVVVGHGGGVYPVHGLGHEIFRLGDGFQDAVGEQV